MAYLRWSNSPFYVFSHVTDGPPVLAIWTGSSTGVYERHEIEALREALDLWLEDLDEDNRQQEVPDVED